MDDSQLDNHHESDNPSRGITESSTNTNESMLSRLRSKAHAFWLWVVQKWPSVRNCSSSYVQSVYIWKASLYLLIEK